MKPALFAFTSRLLVLAATLVSLRGFAQETRPILSGTFMGAPEISGAALLPDGTLVLASGENNVWTLPDAAQVFGASLAPGKQKTGLSINATHTQVPAKGALKPDDMEDVAWDWAGTLYIVTSHSITKKGKDKAERKCIVRWPIVATGALADTADYFQNLEDVLPTALKEATGRTPAQGGFNIEGAAIVGNGDLVLGLRAPTHTVSDERGNSNTNEDAVLLRVPQPNQNNWTLSVLYLNLAGLCVRGMCYDSRHSGCWIAAGISPDLPDTMAPNATDEHSPRQWQIRFWLDGEDYAALWNVPASVHLRNVEAICCLELGPQKAPYLLLVEDAKGVSPFYLVPVP